MGRIIYRTIVVAVLLAGAAVTATVGAARSEGPATGIELFIDGCRYQGTNPVLIRTGHAEFDLVVTTQAKSSDDVNKESDQRIKDARVMLNQQTDEIMKKTIQTAIDRIPAVVRKRNNGERKSRVKMTFNGNDPSGMRKSEVINFDFGADAWERPLQGLRNRGLGQGSENVVYDPATGMATLSKSDLAMFEFQAFGRMQGTGSKYATAAMLPVESVSTFEFDPGRVNAFRSVVKEKSQKESTVEYYKLTGPYEYDDGRRATRVDTLYTKDGTQRYAQRYAIDPERGHICPLIQLYDTDGNVGMEYLSSGYFLDKHSGLWFPSQYQFTHFMPGGVAIRERRQYTIDKLTFKVNAPISDDEFSLSVPPGTMIVDDRSATQKQYRAPGTVQLALSNAPIDLSGIEEIVAAEGQPARSRRGILFASLASLAGVVAVGVAVVLLRRRARRGTGLASLLLLSTALASGCGTTEPVPVADEAEGLGVPKELDLGRLRRSDTHVTARIEAVNPTSRDITIDRVTTGCSCAAADEKSYVVRAGDTCTIPILISLSGKAAGPYATNVALHISNCSTIHYVGIHAVIIDDFWVGSTPVHVTIPRGDVEAEGSFDVYTAQHHDASFVAPGCREESRRRDGNDTAIRFTFRVPVPLHAAHHDASVTLTPNRPDAQPISVPVVVHRDYPKHSVFIDAGLAQLPPVHLGPVPRQGPLTLHLFGVPEAGKVEIQGRDGAPASLATPGPDRNHATSDGEVALPLTVTPQAKLGLLSDVLVITNGTSISKININGIIIPY